MNGNTHTKQSRAVLALSIALFMSLATGAHADEAVVTNSVSVSSNSGGNSVSGGEVVEGTTLNSVDIETTLNGETVQDIHETSTDDIIIEKTVSSNSSGEEQGDTQTNIDVSVHAGEGMTTQGSEPIPELSKETATTGAEGTEGITEGEGISNDAPSVWKRISKLFAYVLSLFGK